MGPERELRLEWQTIQQDYTMAAEWGSLIRLRADVRVHRDTLSFFYEVQNGAGSPIERQEDYATLLDAQRAAEDAGERLLEKHLSMLVSGPSALWQYETVTESWTLVYGGLILRVPSRLDTPQVVAAGQAQSTYGYTVRTAAGKVVAVADGIMRVESAMIAAEQAAAKLYMRFLEEPHEQ